MSELFKVGVVGAGNMGGGIAQKLAQEGLSVTLVDLKDDSVQRGLSIIKNTLQQGVERKVLTAEQMQETMSRIHGTSSMEALADADLVIEAVFEDMEVKGLLFKRLDGICQPKTIFATNTSSFYVRELAKYTSRPDRVIGMHYFFHPAKNQLLEVIPHHGTSAATLEKALLIGKLHGKTNIVVKDAPGFAINRFFVPFLTESVRLLEEGIANIPTIEEGAKQAFKIGMGPFELMNVTGIPIAVHASTTLGKEISPFYGTPQLLIKQMDVKTLWDLSGEVIEARISAVADRLLGATLGVACALVDDGVATKEDTDRGAKIGLRWVAGPFEMMNQLGIEKTYQVVKAISVMHPDFKIPEILIKQYKLGKPFEFTFVDLEKKNGIAYITINRPEAMNALNPLVVDQIEKKFNEAQGDKEVKAIVFQGAGKAFIAGADIKFFVDNVKSNTIDKTVVFTKKGHELLRQFETSPKLTIAVLDGLSLGGGSELALACQAIVATPKGSFGFPECGIGIYPGFGGMIRMAHHVGRELAKYYVFTGRSIKAAEAFELGIVTKLVEPADVEKAIKKIVAAGPFDKYRTRPIPASYNNQKTICTDANVARLLKGELLEGVEPELAAKTAKIIAVKAPFAVKVANELIDAQSKVSIEAAIELELGRLVEIFTTEDALAGLQAPPGRPPKYQGK